MRLDDETRSLLAGLSYYAGHRLPAPLADVARTYGLTIPGWMYPAPFPSQPEGHAESTPADLLTLGDSLRQRAADAGITLLVPGQAGWPAGPGCDDLPCLWVRGDADLAALLQSSVTITGARASTAYGDYLASDLAYTLGEAGLTVVTGTAAGIDARAAVATLTRATRPPVVVAAAGLDHRFNRTAAGIITKTARHGAVVSAFPPGLKPSPARWSVRDRMLATLSTATVIVEARVTSRAMHTARAAAASGKAVCAVPGPVTSGVSTGCHQLIADGAATLTANSREVLAAIEASSAQQQLYQIVAFVRWHDGWWRSRHVPAFHVRAASHAHAANAALDIVLPDATTPAQLTVGVLDMAGVFETVEITAAAENSSGRRPNA